MVSRVVGGNKTETGEGGAWVVVVVVVVVVWGRGVRGYGCVLLLLRLLLLLQKGHGRRLQLPVVGGRLVDGQVLEETGEDGEDVVHGVPAVDPTAPFLGLDGLELRQPLGRGALVGLDAVVGRLRVRVWAQVRRLGAGRLLALLEEIEQGLADVLGLDEHDFRQALEEERVDVRANVVAGGVDGGRGHGGGRGGFWIVLHLFLRCCVRERSAKECKSRA